jgi:chemotaxis protein methyltransferase CheR
VLRPQGLLFAGHSENFAGSKDLFRLRGKTVYERV